MINVDVEVIEDDLGDRKIDKTLSLQHDGYVKAASKKA